MPAPAVLFSLMAFISQKKSSRAPSGTPNAVGFSRKFSAISVGAGSAIVLVLERSLRFVGPVGYEAATALTAQVGLLAGRITDQCREEGIADWAGYFGLASDSPRKAGLDKERVGGIDHGVLEGLLQLSNWRCNLG